jgi:phage recombination protein Bet
MSTEKQLVSVDKNELSWTPEQVDLIKRQIAKDATNDELTLFLYQAKKSGLDPLAKQIYFQKRNNRPVFITAIDGYRLVASRTGQHAGTDDAVFDDEKEPNRATVTTYRMLHGVRCSFTATARWSEYCPPQGQDHMWIKMPCTMLGKCAEALALRKAFPQELGGVYTKEEMDQSGSVDVPPSPPPVVVPKKWTPTEIQLKKLFAISKAAGWATEDLRSYLKRKYAIGSSSDLNQHQYDELLEYLCSGAKPMVAHGSIDVPAEETKAVKNWEDEIPPPGF